MFKRTISKMRCNWQPQAPHDVTFRPATLPRESHPPDYDFRLLLQAFFFLSSFHTHNPISHSTMAAPRLPFLYPNLMRAVRSCEPSTHHSVRFPSTTRSTPRASFHASRRSREQETYHRRYGPAAATDLPPPSRPKDESAGQSPAGQSGNDSSKVAPPEESQSPAQSQSQSQDLNAAQNDTENQTEAHSLEENPPADLESEEEPLSTNNDNAPEPTELPDEQREIPPDLRQNPLADVLHMPSPSGALLPSSVSNTGDKPPHLAPGPYVHHFDTYSLVRDLSKGGFSDEQSITIMKAVRGILHNNVDLARDSLISKSDDENESYLFKAACSELQSSLQTARNSEMQRQRTSRTQLQHESDILSQRMNQELAGLKDDIKGMFNNHKMTTREQQRSIDTSVQELNYKITVSLNSDGKSEIEGLRWILTRRAAFAVAISACKSSTSRFLPGPAS